MNKKLLELLNAINAKKAEVKALVESDKLDEAKTAKEELKAMQEKFDILKDMEDEETPVDHANATPASKGNTFAQNIRALPQNALNETTGTQGGYTVPEDVQTKINHYKESHRSMRDLVRVEPVTTNKGSRVYETKTAVTGFEEVAEDGSIPALAEPTFEQVTYNIKDYAGYLPVTNDLLNDNDANLEAEIVDWIGRNSLATDNAKILALAKVKTATPIASIDDIKTAVIATIGSAYDCKIVTNDSGLAWLDTLKDTNKRYLLNPDPTEPTKLQLRCGAKIVPVEVFSDAELPNQGGKAPFIIGDLNEAFHIFDRQQTVIYASKDAMVTDATGKPLFNAFQQRGTLYRGEMRADYKAVDNAAFVYGELNKE